jgi:hypothetical protein
MNVLSKPEESRGPGLYFSLLAVESVGIAIILLNGMPVYHEMMRDVAGYRPQPGVLWLAWVGIILVLGAYILRIRLRPPMPRSGHAIAGHVVFFVGRMSFVAATSAYSLIFINHFGELHLLPYRMMVILLELFAMFCWTLELERLAKALMGTAGEPLKTKQP